MNTKRKFRLYFLVYIVAAITSVGLQTILKLFFMDPVTGFYFRENTVASILSILLAVIVTGAILFWFISMLFAPTKHDFALDYSHQPTSVLSILVGLSILLYTVFDAMQQTTVTTISANMQKFSYFIVFFMGIIAAVSMIVGGFQPEYGRFGKPGAILGIFPGVWQLILLIVRFNSFIAITTISDVLFHVLFMCFAAIFLLGQSRLVYGLGVRHGASYAFPSGFAASLVGFCLVIPNLINFLVKNLNPPVSSSVSIWELIYIFLLSIYAIVFLAGYSRSIKTV